MRFLKKLYRKHVPRDPLQTEHPPSFIHSHSGTDSGDISSLSLFSAGTQYEVSVHSQPCLWEYCILILFALFISVLGGILNTFLRISQSDKQYNERGAAGSSLKHAANNVF